MAVIAPHVNPSDETIRVGLLTVRFLLTADNSSGSIAAFELTVPGAQRLLAPAHSHDHYEETIYGIDGVLTWTVDGRQIEVGPGQALCIPLMFSPWIFISFQVLVKDPISGSVVVCVQCRGRQDHLWLVSALDPAFSSRGHLSRMREDKFPKGRATVPSGRFRPPNCATQFARGRPPVR